MRQQDVFKKIGNILQELNEQYDYLQTQGENIDDLELELFAANAHFLADHLEILRKLNAQVIKSLPPHQPTAEDKPSFEPEPEAEEQEEPAYQLYRQTSEETPVIELAPTVSDVMPAAGQYHVEQPEDEGTEDPEHDFKFDFTPSQPEEEEVPEAVEPAETAPFEYHFTVEDQPEESTAEADEPVYEELTETPAEPEQQIHAEHHEADEPAPQIDLDPDTGHDHFSFIRSTEPDIIRHELTLDEADTWETEDEQETPHEETVAEAMAALEPTPEPAPHVYDQEPQTNPVAVDPERPLTLNERISAQLLGTNAAPSAPQPIKDLKSAITLNDKMLFVRDLFNGYSLAYSEAIEILNRFNNFEDADRFLTSNYVNKNDWASKPSTTEKFYDLLRRRFA